ncbi:DUF4197 domain-containing protein [Nitrosophilus kaiyonis]|uniref:DUF4197 domain-containing protein n=1 Tax=Nitrosophilus kaiyonis TaxID=2930200 RepID=UPI00248F94DC|nr:DUF4197 domain-containing protein [Nitrosophilus kaiyonis]
MKKIILISAILLTLNAGFFDSLKKFFPSESKNSTIQNSNLSQYEISSGLKEALQKGVEYAVENLGKTDGFWKNTKVKIPLPNSLQKVATYLKKAGFEKYVDEFELSLNRAAEKATPKTAEIFINVIKNMSIEDAKKILKGGDNAATLYLREKTQDKLYSLIYPIVKENIDKVGSIKYYNQIKEIYNKYAKPYTKNQTFSSIKNMFFNNKKQKNELDEFSQKDIYEYTTSKTLDGIFKMIEEEEKKIRKNPVERTTTLLKKVFS